MIDNFHCRRKQWIEIVPVSFSKGSSALWKERGEHTVRLVIRVPVKIPESTFWLDKIYVSHSLLFHVSFIKASPTPFVLTSSLIFLFWRLRFINVLTNLFITTPKIYQHPSNNPCSDAQVYIGPKSGECLKHCGLKSCYLCLSHKNSLELEFTWNIFGNINGNKVKISLKKCCL